MLVVLVGAGVTGLDASSGGCAHQHNRGVWLLGLKYYESLWYYYIQFDTSIIMIRCMINDMVWYNEWCDIWWYIWYDVWHHVTPLGIFYDMTWHGVIYVINMIWYDVIWYMIWYDIWYDAIYDTIYVMWCAALWCGVTLRDVTWREETWHAMIW